MANNGGRASAPGVEIRACQDRPSALASNWIYSRRLGRRSLKCVSHSCWLRRLLLHRRECNFIRPGAAFRLREKNLQRHHAARVRALLWTRCCWKSANWRGVCLIYVTHVLHTNRETARLSWDIDSPQWSFSRSREGRIQISVVNLNRKEWTWWSIDA